MAGAMVKRGEAQELVDFVEAALAAEPNHPLYAEMRKAQGETLLGVLKQPGAAHDKYADAMAHSAPGSYVYEESLYRAGDALFRQAASVAGVDTARFIDLSAQAEILMKQYLNLPARANVYPENIKRRMVAQWRTKDYAAMEREAAWFLTDEGNLDGEAKLYCGKSLYWAADDWMREGGLPEQTAILRATSRKILTECVRDEKLRASPRMVPGYYCLGDFAAQKEVALKNLAKLDPNDADNRAEMMIYAGVGFAYQKPPDNESALKYFEGVLGEYDKNPAAVRKMSVNAVHWGVGISLAQKDEARAREFMKRLPPLPACAMKTSLMNDYKYLLDE